MNCRLFHQEEKRAEERAREEKRLTEEREHNEILEREREAEEEERAEEERAEEEKTDGERAAEEKAEGERERRRSPTVGLQMTFLRLACCSRSISRWRVSEWDNTYFRTMRASSGLNLWWLVSISKSVCGKARHKSTEHRKWRGVELSCIRVSTCNVHGCVALRLPHLSAF